MKLHLTRIIRCLSFAKSVLARSVRAVFSRNNVARLVRKESLPTVCRLSFLREFPAFLNDGETAACGTCVMRCQTVSRSVVYIGTRQSFPKENRRQPREAFPVFNGKETTSGLSLLAYNYIIKKRKENWREQKRTDVTRSEALNYGRDKPSSCDIIRLYKSFQKIIQLYVCIYTVYRAS